MSCSSQLLRNNDGVRDVGGASGEGEGREGREAREKEMMNEMRERLGHMQDEYTQVTTPTWSSVTMTTTLPGGGGV